MRYVVIMAGGSGTRLWPLSRRGTPKQLLTLFGGKSLLRLAFERALGLVSADRVLVVTGASYLGDVRADLPEVAEKNLLGEPEGRDSLNA
ncbi:MAG: sugar phosphate nucleotidyltransferase, partial [Actinomycetes bacterium]